MFEGEKQKRTTKNDCKKVYEVGERISFRVPKKFRRSEEIIEFINAANKSDELNIEIVKAIELYIKYKRFMKTLQGSVMNEDQFQFIKFISKEKLHDNELNDYEINGAKEILIEDPRGNIINDELNKKKVEAKQIKEDQTRKIITVPDWKQVDDNDDAANELFDIVEKPKNNAMAKAFKSLRR